MFLCILCSVGLVLSAWLCVASGLSSGFILGEELIEAFCWGANIFFWYTQSFSTGVHLWCQCYHLEVDVGKGKQCSLFPKLGLPPLHSVANSECVVFGSKFFCIPIEMNVRDGLLKVTSALPLDWDFCITFSIMISCLCTALKLSDVN